MQCVERHLLSGEYAQNDRLSAPHAQNILNIEHERPLATFGICCVRIRSVQKAKSSNKMCPRKTDLAAGSDNVAENQRSNFNRI